MYNENSNDDAKAYRNINGWFCAGQQRKISGVCAGFAGYYQQPIWLIRLLAIMLLITAPVVSISAYFIAAIVLPKR